MTTTFKVTIKIHVAGGYVELSSMNVKKRFQKILNENLKAAKQIDHSIYNVEVVDVKKFVDGILMHSINNK